MKHQDVSFLPGLYQLDTKAQCSFDTCIGSIDSRYIATIYVTIVYIAQQLQ